MKYILELHASSLDNYADCPLRGFASLMKDYLVADGYEIKELTRYITPEVGTAIHAGVAALHTQDGEPKEVAKKTISDFINGNPDVRLTERFKDSGFIHDHIELFIDAYIEQVLPQRSPLLVEHSMEGEISDDIIYKTTLDLYTTDDMLADLKSGAKQTPAYNQLGFYLLLLQKQGYKPKRAVLDYILPEKYVRDAQGKPIYKHKPIEYNTADCLQIVKQTLRALITDYKEYAEAGKIDHIGINPRSDGCNAYMCPMFGTNTCPGWRKK